MPLNITCTLREQRDPVHTLLKKPSLLCGRQRRRWLQCNMPSRAKTASRLTVVDEVERAKNRTKSKVRARVEHAIGVIKRVFGFAKVRYRGLKKNTHRLLVTCALANLFMARRHLLRCQPA